MVISKMSLSELYLAHDACAYVVSELEKLQTRIYDHKETVNADLELKDVLSNKVFDCKTKVLEYENYIADRICKLEP